MASEPVKDERALAPPRDGHREVTAADALRIAEQAYLKHRRGLAQHEFEASLREADEIFLLLFKRVPKMPGGHTLIVVSKNGEVDRIIRGK